MRLATLAVVTALAAFGQNNPVTPLYPSAVDDTQLGVFADRAYSTLASPVSSTATTLTVADGSRFPDAEYWVMVCPLNQCGVGASAANGETIFITGKASTHVLTIGATGRDVQADQTGTATGAGTAPTHGVGEAVVLAPAAGQMNRWLAELKAAHAAVASVVGAGSGNTSQGGTYADLSSVMGMEEGDVYFFDHSDTPYTHAVYNGSSWDLWYMGRKCTSFVPGDFSWVNQGAASYASYGGATVITTPKASSNLRLLVKSQPTPPYTITVLFSHWEPSAGGGNAWAGPVWREVSTSEIHGVGIQDSVFDSSKWSSATTFSANYVGGAATLYRAPLFLARIRRNSGRIVEIADNPLAPTTWIQYDSQGDTDFLSADQVGFHTYNNSTSTGTMYTTILSWEED